MRLKKGDKVKIIQEEAPYGFEGKEGTVLFWKYDDNEYWYMVEVGEMNEDTPYESWFLREHLEKIG